MAFIPKNIKATFSIGIIVEKYQPDVKKHYIWLKQLAYVYKKFRLPQIKKLWRENPFGLAIPEESIARISADSYYGDYYRALADMLIKHTAVDLESDEDSDGVLDA